jgi:signal transduction histidine kinase
LFRLRPPDIDELGLSASLEGLVAGWNGRSRGAPRFEITLSGNLDPLPEAVGVSLYRIVQEALTNAAKHSGATRVVTQLALRAADVTLSIDDDGRPGESAAKSGMGLLGMRERVAAIGGQLSFESRPDEGSSLRVIVPVASLQDDASRLEHAA